MDVRFPLKLFREHVDLFQEVDSQNGRLTLTMFVINSSSDPFRVFSIAIESAVFGEISDNP